MTTWTLDSLYLSLLVKSGLIGTLAFLWLLWSVLRLARQTFKNAEEPHVRAFAAAATAVIIAMAALGVSDGSMVNGRFALVYATLFGLIAVVGNRKALFMNAVGCKAPKDCPRHDLRDLGRRHRRSVMRVRGIGSCNPLPHARIRDRQLRTGGSQKDLPTVRADRKPGRPMRAQRSRRRSVRGGGHPDHIQRGLARGAGGSHRLSRSDRASPSRRNAAVDPTDRRHLGDRAASQNHHGRRLPTRRHGGGRTGGAPRSPCRLSAVQRRREGAAAVEHRRDLQCDGAAGRWISRTGNRVRPGSGKHADRCRGEPLLQ